MPSPLPSLRHSLMLKLLLTVGLSVFVCLVVWGYLNIRTHEKTVQSHLVHQADRLSTTIKLGAHYAMLINSREDLAQIVSNTARQDFIQSVRIYNKDGAIKFSNDPREVDTVVEDMAQHPACSVCHQTEPPRTSLRREERLRFFKEDGERFVGVMTPIMNESSCVGPPCHFHPKDSQVLGLLDVVVSMRETEETVAGFTMKTVAFAVVAMGILALAITAFVVFYVKRPVQKLIEGTKKIAAGEEVEAIVYQDDELGQLADAIVCMGNQILAKQTQLTKQRREYKDLFERVPCLINVLDRDYRLVRGNRECMDRFRPSRGDHCYRFLKGRDCRCEDCPLETTFETGRITCSEQLWTDEEGEQSHWLVTTSPITDDKGDVVAAMEMCLDITSRKELEQRLAISEKKYNAIFNNIPNAVFVLDAQTLEVQECNEAVPELYGYAYSEVMGLNFLEFFREEERSHYANVLRTSPAVNQAVQLTKTGRPIYVSLWMARAAYGGHDVLLVTASDISKRLETEQQLIQTSKMATVGEMATGVAHELNQPLSVIKTAASFLARKAREKQPVREEILGQLTDEISSHVDRASKIINHMREFGRKPELKVAPVQLNTVLRRAFDIFSQQLKLRAIEVVWELDDDLPRILAEDNRLEQIFINLLINARDAIEERAERDKQDEKPAFVKRITLRTETVTAGDTRTVRASICDTGPGVDPAFVDKIFEPFFTTKEVGKGTGLGLSISYSIAKDYGGAIHAIANPQETGACFVLEFPAEPA